jgi:peptidoglycan hydrolase-like protein with peptidoglycan-binding domain
LTARGPLRGLTAEGALLARTARGRTLARCSCGGTCAECAGTEDRDHLTSPRFMTLEGTPEPVLEACFEDRTRLAPGARDPQADDVGPVAKVQQALIDLHYDLGPSGADGDYGSRTAAAVRAFKASEGLGFEMYGAVGPGTMRRLDELFPPSLPVCRPPYDEPILEVGFVGETRRERCNSRRHRDPPIGGCRPKPATPGVCGPDVTTRVKDAWTAAQTDFRRLGVLKRLDNCRMLIQPIARDPDTGELGLNADAFDTWGLYQGSVWTRMPPWHGPCGTPGTAGRECDQWDGGHECDTVCSNTVQIGGECWLSGTVNYGLFGVIMRECHDLFLGLGGRTAAIPFSLPATMALVGGYKALKGDNIIGPEKWATATWARGPAATATGGNRPNCNPTCPGPSPPVFLIVWEPHMPRSAMPTTPPYWPTPPLC